MRDSHTSSRRVRCWPCHTARKASLISQLMSPVPRPRFRLRSLLVAATVIACFLAYQGWQERKRADVAVRYNEFRRAIAAKEYHVAYSMMSEEYRKWHPLKVFKVRFASPLPPLQPGCGIWLNGDRAEVYPNRCRFFELLSGGSYFLEKKNGRWFFTGDGNWYLD